MAKELKEKKVAKIAKVVAKKIAKKDDVKKVTKKVTKKVLKLQPVLHCQLLICFCHQNM